jgi:hypothetical protein
MGCHASYLYTIPSIFRRKVSHPSSGLKISLNKCAVKTKLKAYSACLNVLIFKLEVGYRTFLRNVGKFNFGMWDEIAFHSLFILTDSFFLFYFRRPFQQFSLHGFEWHDGYERWIGKEGKFVLLWIHYRCICSDHTSNIKENDRSLAKYRSRDLPNSVELTYLIAYLTSHPHIYRQYSCRMRNAVKQAVGCELSRIPLWLDRWRWDCQPYAPTALYSPEIWSGTHFC